MATVSYHASHEQFAPSHLLQLVKLAEQAGFKAIHSSDHFHPWSVRQGQSGFSFSWLGAAMQASTLPFSVVCAPGQRYHPAIVAQAMATLAEMFPGRFHIELGSGEALNEMITAEPWPPKEVRNERLMECVTIIRRLLHGQEVTFAGHINVFEATLYTLPAQLPAIYAAALSEETARWAGEWADGLLTTGGDLEATRQKIAAFKQHGGEGKPVSVQWAFSYSQRKDEAIAGAYQQWRTNLVPADKLDSLHKPELFDAAAAGMTMQEIPERIHIITSMHQLYEEIDKYSAIGADTIILHNVNTQQEQFIADFGHYH
jgi:coenzyme F420-dependent glucose-6-phosphate dehydrogenase